MLPLAVGGSERAFRLRTTPMRDGDRRLGAITLLEGITRLREIDRLKSEFIATASHELRTPLTSVQMAVHLVTAYASIELAVEAMKLGSTDFMRKPMTPEIVRDALAAALAKPSSPATAASVMKEESEAPPRAIIEYVTMNGFSYVDAPESDDSKPLAPNERRFLVKNPRGWEKEVVVEIDPEAIGYVERMTRRKLPPSSSFWAVQASNFLGAFLWNEGRLPDGRLTLRDVDRDDLPVAERWKDD